MTRPTQASIDLSALLGNYRLACALAPASRNMAVIKADAYGHGALAVARALEDQVPAFAVACVEEAVQLRQGGIGAPILVLGGAFGSDDLHAAAQHNLWLMLENERQAQLLENTELARPIGIWLKADTGMHRLGVDIERAPALLARLRACANRLGDIVLATHFASADELDNDFTRHQSARLRALAAQVNAPVSLANSPALLAWPDSHGDWNRPGYMLYGDSPFPVAHPEGDKLIPVMTFGSRVMSVRTLGEGESVGYGQTWCANRATTIATVPVGYGDGYPRGAPSGTPVLVNGQRAPLVGRVSMDLISVDVTGLTGIAAGAEVELWGKNLPVGEVAKAAGTIGYELLARMPGRVPRIYSGDRFPFR